MGRKKKVTAVVEPVVIKKVLRPQHICIGILKARGDWKAKYRKLSLDELNDKAD